MKKLLTASDKKPQITPTTIDPKNPYPQKAVFKSNVPSINLSQDVSLLDVVFLEPEDEDVNDFRYSASAFQGFTFGFSCVGFGTPQLGQVAASVETFFLHSLQGLKAIAKV